MPAPPTVPSNVLVGLYQFLQTTGLNYTQLAQVGTLLGATVAPTPPAVSPLVAEPPVNERPGTAQQQDLDKAQEMKRQAVISLQQQNLTHPTNLASQLLGNTPTALAGTVPAQTPRQGRSPVPKRKLPPRTGEADKASTYQSPSPSGRSASRTPDRGALGMEQTTKVHSHPRFHILRLCPPASMVCPPLHDTGLTAHCPDFTSTRERTQEQRILICSNIHHSALKRDPPICLKPSDAAPATIVTAPVNR